MGALFPPHCTSRIRLDTGKVVHDGWDYLRSEKVLREIEKDYGLFQVKSREKQQKAVSTGGITVPIRIFCTLRLKLRWDKLFKKCFLPSFS